MADAIDKTNENARPLSPHIGIYKQQINLVMSIVHRLTGAALYFGTLLLAWWLLAVAQGPQALDIVNIVMGHPLGKIVLVGYTWALFHHMFGGIRHFIWDTGRGFDLGSVNRLGWLTIIASLAVTAALWAYALHTQGVF